MFNEFEEKFEELLKEVKIWIGENIKKCMRK
jgi:hypothetical protein